MNKPRKIDQTIDAIERIVDEQEIFNPNQEPPDSQEDEGFRESDYFEHQRRERA